MLVAQYHEDGILIEDPSGRTVNDVWQVRSSDFTILTANFVRSLGTNRYIVNTTVPLAKVSTTWEILRSREGKVEIATITEPHEVIEDDAITDNFVLFLGVEDARKLSSEDGLSLNKIVLSNALYAANKELAYMMAYTDDEQQKAAAESNKEVLVFLIAAYNLDTACKGNKYADRYKELRARFEVSKKTKETVNFAPPSMYYIGDPCACGASGL
jgi:hypothetical protein